MAFNSRNNFDAPEVRLGLTTRVVNSLLSGLGTVGTVLDTPGSIARGLIAGDVDRAFGGIFNPSERVSGTELLGGDKSEFTLGGLGVELITDPINFLTAGSLTAAGKVATRASKLQKSATAQRAVVNNALPGSRLHQTAARRLQQTDEALAGLTDTTPLAKNFPEQAASGQRALVGFRLPFQQEQIPLIQGQRVFNAGHKVKSSIASLPAVQKTTDVLSTAFKRELGDPVAESLRQELRIADRLAQRTALNRSKELKGRIKELKAEYGDEVDEQIRRVIEVTDLPEKLKLKDVKASDDKAAEFLKLRLKVAEELDSIPQAVKDFAQELRDINKELLEDEIKTGVAISELDDIIGFFARQTTVKGAQLFENRKIRKYLNEQVEKLRLPTAGTQRERFFRGNPTKELEEELRKQFPEEFDKVGFKKGETVFDNDIARLQARRELQGDLASNRAVLAQAVVETFQSKKGRPIADLIRPSTKVAGHEIQLGPLVISTKLPLKGVQSRHEFMSDLALPVERRTNSIRIPKDASAKDIKNILRTAKVQERNIPEEVFDDVSKIFKGFKDPLIDNEFTKPFIKLTDTLHGLYRGALTGYFPAFHARNFISGAFMNTLAGDVRPTHYADALFRLKNLDDAEHIRLASLGVLDEGRIRETVSIIRAPGETKLGPIDVTKASEAAFAPARKVGQLVENANRYALFLAKKAKGLTDTEAADFVRKYHFDYDDLTDFERAVPRRGLLFYTFTRNNIPLLMEEYFKNPRFLQAYARLTGLTNENIVQPEWLPDSFFFGEDEKGNTLRVNFGLPPEDLARFDPDGKGLQRVLELFIANTVPAIRGPFEFATGRSAFLGRPQEGGAIERVAELSPASRAVATVRRLVESVPEGRFGEEAFRFGTGINARAIDEDRQRLVNQGDIIRDKLDDLVRQGKGRRITIVGNRAGESNEEINALNSALGKINSALARQRR